MNLFDYDYKFFCFHGRVELVQVDADRFLNHTRAIMDRHFERLPVTFQYPPITLRTQKPQCFEQMIRVAELLAAGEKFIRVDLYDLGRPIFGELTLHPESGLGKFDPPEWDRLIYRFI